MTDAQSIQCDGLQCLYHRFLTITNEVSSKTALLRLNSSQVILVDTFTGRIGCTPLATHAQCMVYCQHLIS